MQHFENDPKEELRREMSDLMLELTSHVSPIGDWKLAKYQEYLLAGEEAPYDIKEIHKIRESKRQRIREIREELGEE